MVRATQTVVATLFIALAASPAWAQSNNQTARLAPGASVDLDVPTGWLGTALTAHDGDLWVGAHSVRGPSTLLRYAPGGELRGQLKTTSQGNVGGIAFDDQGVCNLDYSTNIGAGKRQLQRFSANGTLRRASSSAAGAHNTFGLAWHGDGFFQGHSPTVRKGSVIHRLDADGRQISAREVPFYTRGMAWHDGQLWVTTGTYHTLHVLDRNLDLVRTYQLSVPLADIAFANGQLIGLEQNRNRLHYFQVPSATPTPRPRGSVVATAEPSGDRDPDQAGWRPW